MENQNLFISKDAKQILDVNGNVVAVRKEVNGRVFYTEVGLNDEGEGKICVEFKQQRACITWDEKEMFCIEWGGLEVCVKWEYPD